MSLDTMSYRKQAWFSSDETISDNKYGLFASKTKSFGSLGPNICDFFVMSEQPQSICFYNENIKNHNPDPSDNQFKGNKVALLWLGCTLEKNGEI